MPKVSGSLVFLSLFTSVERAAEIEGDLREEAASRGKIWYFSQTLLTGSSLMRQAMFKDLFIVLLLSVSVLQLILTADARVMDPMRFWFWTLLDDSQAFGSLAISYGSWAVTAFLWGVVLQLALGKYGIRTVIVLSLIILMKVPLNWGLSAPAVSTFQVLVLVILPLFAGGLQIHTKRVARELAVMHMNRSASKT